MLYKYNNIHVHVRTRSQILTCMCAVGGGGEGGVQDINSEADKNQLPHALHTPCG